jgi:serine/threonine-protein kinase RsbW
MMEKRFERTVDALDSIFDFISQFSGKNGVSGELLFKLNLAIEEVFVNMVRHNAGGTSDILIGLERAGDRLIVSLTDSDVEPFDIRQADEYDTSQPLSGRPIGRLGIHLVKRMVDKIDYEYGNRQSKITLIKHLRKANV